MGTRIKGQEIDVLLVSNGIPQDTITNVTNFEIELDLEILKQGYLGKTTDNRDEIYNGVSGKMTIHFEDAAPLRLMRDLVNRARRRVPGFRVNIKATLRLPNGETPKVMIPDAHFGKIPMGFGGRSAYGSIDLNFEAEDFSVLT